MLGIKSLQGYDLNVLTKYPYDDSTDAMNETSGWIPKQVQFALGLHSRTPDTVVGHSITPLLQKRSQVQIPTGQRQLN